MNDIAKQVIVVRRDLKMPSGKLAAQVAHASMGALFSQGKYNENELVIPLNEINRHWLSNSFVKVVVSVNSLEELLDIYNQAKNALLPCVLIEDNGRTVFNGVVTPTVVGIGPALIPEIDKVTKHLKLYRD